MARIDKRRTKGSRPNAQRVTSTPRRGSSGGSAIEDTMFFPRLRRHTKWMFVLLALFFGVGFVAFGVGAGGTGIGNIFQNHQSGGGGESVKSALSATQKRPNDSKAWSDLANVYRLKGEVDQTIAAQTRYTQLAPKDADGFRTLASDYFDQARQKATARTGLPDLHCVFGLRLARRIGPDPQRHAALHRPSGRRLADTGELRVQRSPSRSRTRRSRTQSPPTRKWPRSPRTTQRPGRARQQRGAGRQHGGGDPGVQALPEAGPGQLRRAPDPQGAEAAHEAADVHDRRVSRLP